MVGPVIEASLQRRELNVELFKGIDIISVAHLYGSLAELADVVILCEELMDAGSLGGGGNNGCYDAGAHIYYLLLILL